MKRFIFTLIAVICSVGIMSAARITGKVLDWQKQPLAGVTVQLYQLPDSVRKGFVVTPESGKFSLSGIKRGKYSLKITMIGMEDFVKRISVSDTTKVVALGDIILQESAVMLNDAVVTAIKTAVVAKEDTLEFNAGSFKTQANASVEDLLKKLPGVEVDSDGKITSGGKSVSKILVDGKEFFGSDTQTATKNLPSDLIDKVQVVDRKSDLARLTGVDDGEDETVINLTVKKGMKDGWFGNLGVGYGTDRRYEGKMNISTFSDLNQISIIGGANNVNELGFGDSGRGRFNGFGGSNGITSAQRLGLNFNIGKTEDLRFGGNVFYSHSDQESASHQKAVNLYKDGVTQTSISNSRSTDIGHNARGDFRLEWKMDKNNTLDFRPSFSFNKRDGESYALSNLWNVLDDPTQHVNKNVSKKYNNGTGYDLEGRLIFNHNFESRPGRSFSVQANYSLSNTFQNNTSWNRIERFMEAVESGDADLSEYYRFMDNSTISNRVGTRLSFTEPIGDVKNGNFFQVAYRMNLRLNSADQKTYDLPLGSVTEESVEDYKSVPEGAIYSKENSNIYDNVFNTQELQVGYKKVNKMYNLEAGLLYSPSGISREDKENPEKNLSNWVWTNVAPFARLQYKFSKQTSLRADYRARSSQPSINQMQPVADVSNPNNIIQGNPNLKPSFSQNFGLHFNGYNVGSQRSINAMLNGSYTSNNVVTKRMTDLTTGSSYTTYENASGDWSAMGMVMVNQPFANKKWRLSVRTMGRYSSSIGYTNGVFNRSGNLMLRPSIGLTYSNDYLQISVNPNYGYQLTTSTLSGQKDRTANSGGARGDLAINLPFGLSINSDLNYTYNGGFSGSNFITSADKSSYLWNAQVSYSMLANKSLTLSARVYDILRDRKNYVASNNSQGTTETWYDLNLGRYVMFGISYTFNTMQGKKKPEMDNMMVPGFGPGGPGGPGGHGRGGFGRPPM